MRQRLRRSLAISASVGSLAHCSGACPLLDAKAYVELAADRLTDLNRNSHAEGKIARLRGLPGLALSSLRIGPAGYREKLSWVAGRERREQGLTMTDTLREWVDLEQRLVAVSMALEPHAPGSALEDALGELGAAEYRPRRDTHTPDVIVEMVAPRAVTNRAP